ncbi:hypothetical protein CYJ32_07700 [Alloscardovia omnicolens]|uniref:Uncharacterized protein n=1 Tax=Alloscardovia omnicolens TaxID=419015 RepID=A0A2I1M1L5_9BIFI|nr:hypothetical protein [Alloscardovia omnicolens]PKZ14015.1 hypothetical protein CYJ32_07700 [Alloscardovia omnicolens]
MAASLDDLNRETEDIASDLQNISERLDDLTDSALTLELSDGMPFITLTESEADALYEAVKTSGCKSVVDMLEMKIWKAHRV